MKTMKIIVTVATISTGLSAALVAHADVTNPAVIARTDAMKAIGGGMKTLSGMAKGEIDFDAAKADAALATIVEKGMTLPTLFEPNETDPETEAKPAIWENWDDFVKKSENLVAAAKGVGSISEQGAVGAALGQIGGTCKACHDDYRVKK